MKWWFFEWEEHVEKDEKYCDRLSFRRPVDDSDLVKFFPMKRWIFWETAFSTFEDFYEDMLLTTAPWIDDVSDVHINRKRGIFKYLFYFHLWVISLTTCKMCSTWSEDNFSNSERISFVFCFCAGKPGRQQPESMLR